MERNSRQTDFIRSRSMMAVATGGGTVLVLSVFVVAVALGATRPNAVTSGSGDLPLAMRWVQPIVGQAIVEDALIKQQYGREMGQEVINGMTTIAYLSHSTKGRIQESAYAKALDVDHAALVQWVMGRLIVDLTRQRIGFGVMTENRLANESNQRIIAVAQQIGQQLQDVFKAERQARLDQAKVTEMLNQPRTAERDPKEVGLIF